MSTKANTKTGTGTRTNTEGKPRQCPMYKILVHNDDITTYPFVVAVICEVFKVEQRKAMKIAQEAHVKGLALVAIMPLELAELRVEQAHSIARTKKYPLAFSYEPE